VHDYNYGRNERLGLAVYALAINTTEKDRMTKKLVLALAAMAVAGSALAQVKPENLIKWRQSGYTFMAWNMGKLKGMLIDNPASFNKEQAAAAANVIASIANSGMGALYASGTEKGAGWKETQVKPELFTDKEGVGKVAVAFNKEASELAKVAAGGDVAAIKAQFGKVGEACKACHEKFRKEDH
jgi:cytochrome c556